jgi:hypothetical protein
MESVRARGTVDENGVLHIAAPTSARAGEVDVVVVFASVPTTEWPPGYFDLVVGSIPDLARPPQGEFETRPGLPE